MAVNRPKVQFEVEPEILERVNKALPWGTRRLIFEALTLSILDYLDERGQAEGLGDLVTGAITAKELLERVNHGS